MAVEKLHVLSERREAHAHDIENGVVPAVPLRRVGWLAGGPGPMKACAT